MNRETIIHHIQINQTRMEAILNYLDKVVSELREDISKLDIKNQTLLQELQLQDKKSPEHKAHSEEFCLTPLYIRLKRQLDDQLP